MKVLDLFCGAGGFSQGFLSPTIKSHLAIDINPYALETFRLNVPEAKILEKDINCLHSSDILKTQGSRPDIILASPPCEEFSKANPESRRTAAERIYSDGTARLLIDAIRLIGDLEPHVFIIENVAAIQNTGGKEIIRREFARAGINDVHFNLVRAHQHGNPSRRLRIFISNLRLKIPMKKPLNVMDTIGDLPPLGLESLFDPNNTFPNHIEIPVSADKEKIISKTRWGRGASQFRVTKTKSLPNWVRLFPNRIATSINGLSRYIHPYENRLLTVREHARLMSYPDTFVFTGPTDNQYNQVGESVPPLISKMIAQEVYEHID
ncbi:MAG: DNA cytosine methyltransferase [Candidatus Thorarchaeota archaeon]|nr:DNA cytosine methyltransferase [Candidatus Thorarchaeota archaeon]